MGAQCLKEPSPFNPPWASLDHINSDTRAGTGLGASTLRSPMEMSLAG